MKKFLFCCCAWGIAVANLSYAYTPTATDTQQLTSLKNVLTTTSNADLRKYYQQFVTLEKAVNTSDEKLDYFLTHLRDFSYSQFTLQKNLAKQGSTSVKSDLLQTYKDNIFLNESLSSNCLGRYNTLDNLSFAYNFPTALTIAVRYRESTCSYALPKNGDGPFQIISKDYGNGEITEALFLQTVEDFLNFARDKINWYNDKNQESGLGINLSYTGASYTDLLRFAALYNGLSGATVYGEISPAAPKYFFEGYTNNIRTGESNKLGLFPMYLKVIEREVNNL